MVAAGVQVQKFHPPHWSNLGRLNNRTHRKLLVVDGRIGFTGGVDIAPPWTGRAQDPEHWRDTHFQVEGPVVGQMQAVFIDNWIEVSGEVLHGPAYFPELVACIVVPGEHIDSETVRSASRATWGPLLEAGAVVNLCESEQTPARWGSHDGCTMAYLTGANK